MMVAGHDKRRPSHALTVGEIGEPAEAIQRTAWLPAPFCLPTAAASAVAAAGGSSRASCFSSRRGSHQHAAFLYAALRPQGICALIQTQATRLSAQTLHVRYGDHALLITLQQAFAVV